jgi:hypothetical protein
MEMMDARVGLGHITGLYAHLDTLIVRMAIFLVEASENPTAMIKTIPNFVLVLKTNSSPFLFFHNNGCD